MYKRAIGLSLAIAIGWLLVLLLRRRLDIAQQQTPSPYVADPISKEMIEPEIQAALETSPGVREVDLAELAFIAGAVGIDITPEASVPPQQNAPPAPPPAPDQASAADQAITGYCMRCRTKRVISGVRLEQASDGRQMARGTCPVCGAKMARFLKQIEQGNQYAKRS